MTFILALSGARVNHGKSPAASWQPGFQEGLL
jgi:hypothetical protein